MSHSFFPAATQAVPTAAAAAPRAAPIFFAVSPSLLNFPSASSLVSAAFLTEFEKSFASSPASSKPLSAFSRAVLLEFSSRSMPFRAACALFSCICQLWVRRSFSPNDSAALARAERSVSIFCFCWSISLFRTSLRAVSASVDLSFLSNCESTSFISEPRTLNELLISARDFLNSFSPSRPIFKPKFSDILRHLLGNGHKKRALRLGDIGKGAAFAVAPNII